MPYLNNDGSPRVPEGGENIVPPPTVLSGFLRTPNSANTCVFQYCQNTSRYRIPENVILKTFCRYNLLISDNCRVCDEHLQQSQWHLLALQDNNLEEFESSQIVSVLNMLKNLSSEFLDFEHYDTIDPIEFHTWIGLTHEQFTDLIGRVSSLNNRTNKKTILAALLAKLRTGDSNARLASIFKTSERNFSRWLNIARDSLLLDFVPLHLGYGHMNREDVARRNLLIPETLFGNGAIADSERKAITIVDGTYIFIQKSSNYFFQRKSYSSHKYRNLVKPLLLVSCDGHIIEVSGPHAATSSDAQIMLNIIENENDHDDGVFNWFYGEGDVFILDRGFRDAIPTMNSYGYSTKTPETKYPGETQLTTEQANKSRLVTICRWVVEVVNGRFKRDFRLLRNVYVNISLPYMFDYFRIAAAILNAYHVLIEDNVHAVDFLQIIQERFNMPNRLSELVNQHNYNRRRAQFQPMSVDMAEFNDFPRLTEEDLVLFGLGVYQMKQARSYYGEHILANGSFIIELGGQIPSGDLADLEGHDLWMVRGRIQSRHVRAKTYYVYIVIDRAANGRQAIAHYYCTCIIGKRTVGCCSHTMCIVWYMGYARHNPQISAPAMGLEDVLIRLSE